MFLLPPVCPRFAYLKRRTPAPSRAPSRVGCASAAGALYLRVELSTLYGDQAFEVCRIKSGAALAD